MDGKAPPGGCEACEGHVAPGKTCFACGLCGSTLGRRAEENERRRRAHRAGELLGELVLAAEYLSVEQLEELLEQARRVRLGGA